MGERMDRDGDRSGRDRSVLDRGRRDRDRDRDSRDRDRERDRGGCGGRRKPDNMDRGRRDRDRDSRDRNTGREQLEDRDRERSRRSRSPRRHRGDSRERYDDRRGGARQEAVDRGSVSPRRGDGKNEMDAGRALQEQYPTAVQVVNMLCEMYAEKNSLPPAIMTQCFSEEPSARLSRLSTGTVVARGRDAIVAALMAAPAGKPKASKTLFVESPDAGDPSMAIAFYAPGAAPGFTCSGLAKPTDGAPCNDQPLALLLRTVKGKIDHIWLAEDKSGLAEGSATKEALLSSSLWTDALEVLRENIPSLSSARFHLNNYATSTDSFGLGIGETSESETFSLPAQDSS